MSKKPYNGPQKNQRGPETPGDALRRRCHRWCVDGVRLCGGRWDPHPWDAFCGSGERGQKGKMTDWWAVEESVYCPSLEERGEQCVGSGGAGITRHCRPTAAVKTPGPGAYVQWAERRELAIICSEGK